MTIVCYAVVTAAVIGYAVFICTYFMFRSKAKEVLRMPDAAEVMADVGEKKPYRRKYYSAVITFETPDGTKTEKHIYTKYYIDNFRPYQIPVVYSCRKGRSATKGMHELRIFEKSFVPLGILLAVIAAVAVYLM